jgi:hypothetical protein
MFKTVILSSIIALLLGACSMTSSTSEESSSHDSQQTKVPNKSNNSSDINNNDKDAEGKDAEGKDAEEKFSYGLAGFPLSGGNKKLNDIAAPGKITRAQSVRNYAKFLREAAKVDYTASGSYLDVAKDRSYLEADQSAYSNAQSQNNTSAMSALRSAMHYDRMALGHDGGNTSCEEMGGKKDPSKVVLHECIDRVGLFPIGNTTRVGGLGGLNIYPYPGGNTSLNHTAATGNITQAEYARNYADYWREHAKVDYTASGTYKDVTQDKSYLEADQNAYSNAQSQNNTRAMGFLRSAVNNDRGALGLDGGNISCEEMGGQMGDTNASPPQNPENCYDTATKDNLGIVGPNPPEPTQ